MLAHIVHRSDTENRRNFQASRPFQCWFYSFDKRDDWPDKPNWMGQQGKIAFFDDSLSHHDGMTAKPTQTQSGYFLPGLDLWLGRLEANPFSLRVPLWSLCHRHSPPHTTHASCRCELDRDDQHLTIAKRAATAHDARLPATLIFARTTVLTTLILMQLSASKPYVRIIPRICAVRTVECIIGAL